MSVMAGVCVHRNVPTMPAAFPPASVSHSTLDTGRLGSSRECLSLDDLRHVMSKVDISFKWLSHSFI